MQFALIALLPWLLWPMMMMNFYFSGTVTCTNTSGDYSAVQSAVSGGGTVTLHGTCLIGTNTISVPANTTVTGDATLTGTGGPNTWVFNVTNDNITINGLTITGGGILTNYTSSYTFLNNLTITNNTFQHIYETGTTGMILLQWAMNNMNISYNHFIDIGESAWGSCTYNSTIGDVFPQAIQGFTTFNNSKIDHNTFSQICGDAVHLADNMALNSSSTITAASNDEVAYNDFQDIWRIAIEWQGTAGGGPYNYARKSLTQNRSIIGNSYHNINKTWYQTWFVSNIPGTNTNYLNNTCVMDKPNPTNVYGQPASCFEVAQEPGTVNVQGNVTATVTGSTNSMKYGYTVAQPGTGVAQYLQNNTHCGPVMQFWHFEPSSTGGTTTVQYNFNNYPSACPGTIGTYTSSITPTWNSGNPTSFPTGGNGTWHMGVVSNMAIISVNFYVDTTSGSPLVGQTLSDISTTYATDRRWLYHATINTSSFGSGSHTLYAVATDTSGATSTISETFSVGSSGTPSTVQPDYFTGTTLKTFWTGTHNSNETITVSGNELRMSLAGGTNNDAFVGGNNSVRVMQTIPSGTDFKIFLRIDALPTAALYNGVGLMVIQDSGTYTRNELAWGLGSTGTYIVNTAGVSGGGQTTYNTTNIGTGITAPYYLYLQRSGTSYTFAYSQNGTTFTALPAYTNTLTEATVGVYAWNYNSTVASSPAYTAQLKYFIPQSGNDILPSSTGIFGNVTITGQVTMQ